MIPFVDPRTGETLVPGDGGLVGTDSGQLIAPIVDGIPRFVSGDQYAESFGWQWNRWESTLSDAKSTGDAKYRLLLARTRFDRYDTKGRALLECGMGGGDDTEVLLRLPFAEVHAFDLTHAVDRAKWLLEDPRVVLSQASIFDVPYADHAFDFVFCHRVIQHTPDPEGALRAACRKVGKNGVLFAHSYKRSWRYLMNYKYKYRWLARRLPREQVYRFLECYGDRLHSLQQRAVKNGRITAFLASSFVPFEQVTEYKGTLADQLTEIAKLCTFDALTPRYDRPMTAARFVSVISSEGLRIEHFNNPKVSPLWCTAVRP